MTGAYEIRDFYRLLIKRTDLSPIALQILVAEYATQTCKSSEDVQDFVTIVYGK